MSDREQRALVEEHLAELVDGDAPPQLRDLLAESDALRDLRFDAERSAQVARDAGLDYVPPPDLEARVLAALAAPDRVADQSARANFAAEIAPSDSGAAPAVALAAAPAPAATERETSVAEPRATAEATSPDPQGHAGPAPSAEPDRDPAAPSPLDQQPAPAAPPVGARLLELVGRHKLLLLGGGGAAALAALAAVLALVATFGWVRSGARVLAGGGWHGEVKSVVAGPNGPGLEICAPSGACSAAVPGAQVPSGALLKTGSGARAMISLADGSEIALDRSTRLELRTDEARRARLEGGAIVADVAHKWGANARFDLPLGQVEVLGTKFSLRAGDRASSVDVSRGSVRLVGQDGAAVVVHAGEEGRIESGSAPRVTATQLLGENMAWSDGAREQREEEQPVRGLGELKAKKPGERDERANAVTLSAHSVKVRVAGALARTEIEEVFTNNSADVLEGIYRFPLPPDARIERLALDVDGKLEEGAFVDRDRAAAIWRGSIVNALPQLRPEIKDEIIWVPGPWRDPALLEWQRGGRFELRIYPIPRHGSRRVVLAYTQLVRPSGGVRRYTYPLAHDPSQSTRVGDFKLDVQVLGHDPAFGVAARGYALTRERSEPGRERLSMSARDFVPSGDLTLEYALPERHAELTVWAYQPGSDVLTRRPSPASATSLDAGSAPTPASGGTSVAGGIAMADDRFPYVAIALRPELPRAKDGERRSVVLVVDSSRSMFGESYRRATRVARRLVAELDPGDRFALLACDSRCRPLPGGLQGPGPDAADEVARFLGGITPEGASDPTAAIAAAAKLSATGADPAPRILYLGDGTPTSGPVRPGSVTRAVRDGLANGRATVNTVAIGGDSDLDTLAAMARAGGGSVLPYTPGQTAVEVAYAALAATYGHALRDVEVELPVGLVAVAPEHVDSIPAGGESLLVARMTRPELTGTLRLRGRLGDEPFEQRYPIKVVASSDAGNAFVPRVYAATRIADLEQRPDPEARAEAVRLSSAFNVASRYTSLLVLESEAMFKAFGLDNTRRAPHWSGEEEAESTSAASGVTTTATETGGGDLRLGGSGSASGGRTFARAPKARKSSAMDEPPSERAEASPAPAAAPAPAPTGPSWPSAEAAPRSAPPRDATRDRMAEELRWQPPRRMVPMRRIWERSGEITTSRVLPAEASLSKIADAERALEQNPDHRAKLKRLYVLYAMAGDTARAGELAERWSEKEPLDPEALTARADLAARAGDRERAIRILGSVVDVRPDDVKAQQRLARLHRWSGQPELGCRHSIAVAQLRSGDERLLAEAVRCAKEAGDTRMADELLGAAEGKVRRAAEGLLTGARPDDGLSGDLRVEGTWTGGADVDLALIDPEGNRVSWLGAPNRAVISATDVLSTSREGLSLRGAGQGEYVLEVVRAAGSGPVSGTLEVTAAGTRRSLPFTLDGERTAIAVVKIASKPRLVPVW